MNNSEQAQLKAAHNRVVLFGVARSITTTAPVQPGDFSNASQEFGRMADVTKVFGLKRGFVYGLLNDGKIRGVLLRGKGQKSGVRLFDMESIRQYIRGNCGI